MEYGSSLPDSGLLCVERNNPVMHMTLKLTFVDRATCNISLHRWHSMLMAYPIDHESLVPVTSSSSSAPE